MKSVSQSVTVSQCVSHSETFGPIVLFGQDISSHLPTLLILPILTLSPTALLIGYSAVNLLISWSASQFLCGMCFMEPGNQTQRQARPVTCTALSLSLKIDEVVPRRKRNTTHTLPHIIFAFDDLISLCNLMYFDMLITMNIIIQSHFTFPSL